METPPFLYNLCMTKVVFGERIGREGKLRLGCSAVILDETRQKVLLTRRADNGQWCLPSGGMEPGESAAEACAREVREETGLHVRVVRLIGVYSDPNQLIIYPDGLRRCHRARAALDKDDAVIGYVFESKGFSRIDIDTNALNADRTADRLRQ